MSRDNERVGCIKKILREREEDEKRRGRAKERRNLRWRQRYLER